MKQLRTRLSECNILIRNEKKIYINAHKHYNIGGYNNSKANKPVFTAVQIGKFPCRIKQNGAHGNGGARKTARL